MKDNQKEKMEMPKMEVIMFDEADVICTSGFKMHNNELPFDN